MTTEQYALLRETVAAAKRIAEANGLHIAVVDALYTEHDSERFQFVPIAGLSALYPNGQAALVGIAYPNGLYHNATEIAALIERGIERGSF